MPDMTTQANAAPVLEAAGRQGFGAMRLRDRMTDPDRDPLAVIHTALDLGVTLIDTADAYGNEELLGRAIRPRREEVLLATKFGLVWHGVIAADFDVRADPAYVRQANEASLRRLGIDVIDLYYLHHRSTTVPIEETVGAMAGLVRQGKVRALGLSNVTADDLHHREQAHGVRVVPLPGTTTVEHLRANVAAADLHLSAADLRHLASAQQH